MIKTLGCNHWNDEWQEQKNNDMNCFPITLHSLMTGIRIISPNGAKKSFLVPHCPIFGPLDSSMKPFDSFQLTRMQCAFWDNSRSRVHAHWSLHSVSFFSYLIRFQQLKSEKWAIACTTLRVGAVNVLRNARKSAKVLPGWAKPRPAPAKLPYRAHYEHGLLFSPVDTFPAIESF